MLILSKYYNTLVTIVFGIHFQFVIAFYLFDWIFKDLRFLFYKAKCVHLKNQTPLTFSLRNRLALGTQFVHARIFFQFFTNSFQIYCKFAYFFIFF